MMKRYVLFFCLLAALASQPASADPLFTTLGPGNSYSLGGWSIGGSDYGSAEIGNSFTLGSAADISDAILALAYIYGDNAPIDLSIESDNGGSPGSVLATLTQVGTIPPLLQNDVLVGGGLITFTCTGVACDLAAGNYWLVASETDSTTLQDWLDTYNNAPTNLAQASDGGPWIINPDYAETAFQMDGSAVATPEPGSFLLLGSGLAGLAGLIKRKLAA